MTNAAAISSFLKNPKGVFFAFLGCGILDEISTTILVRHFGADVERNPLIRFLMGSFDEMWFIFHFGAVLLAAFFLSRESWNDQFRYKVKAMLLVLYMYVLAINWYQVVLLGRQLFS